MDNVWSALPLCIGLVFLCIAIVTGSSGTMANARVFRGVPSTPLSRVGALPSVLARNRATMAFPLYARPKQVPVTAESGPSPRRASTEVAV